MFFLKEEKCCPCTELLLCAGTQCFACALSSYRHSKGDMLLALFHRWGTWGSQRSTFPQSHDWEVVEVGFKSRSDCKFPASTIVWHRLWQMGRQGRGSVLKVLPHVYFSLFPTVSQGLAPGEVGPWSYGTAHVGYSCSCNSAKAASTREARN